MSPPILSPVTLIALALCFAGALFGVAAWVERRRHAAGNSRWRWVAYALSLGVYCTSWTFYGAVGSAASDGWSYLPIYLGPILVMACAPRLLRRLVEAVQAEGATSISDFIGARFGKSQGVAALVTITAALGVIPYVALQLRSVGIAFAALAGGAVNLAMTGSAIVLAAFAMLFGTRRYEVAGRNEAIVFATGFESVVKFLALAAVAAGALWWLGGASAAQVDAAQATLARTFAPAQIGIDVAVITLLSMSAILCLPRQFYLGVIEARAPADLGSARWVLVLYLAGMAAMAIPITLAGLAILPPGAIPDLFVLRLPMEAGITPLALVAFLGGFSAATAMVVVESVALSTMVSNDLIAPLLLRSRRLSSEANLGRVMLIVRRVAIGLVIAAALLWARAVTIDARLAVIGHIAFAAMAQIAPLLLLAVDGRMRDAAAAKAGLSAGLLLWLWTLALPPVLPPQWAATLAGTPIDPHALLGIALGGPLVHGVAWSLGANLLLLTLVALRTSRPSPRFFTRPRFFSRHGVGEVTDMASLRSLAARFVGDAKAAETLGPAGPHRIAPADARQAERLIASVVGAPSARALMASALAGERLGIEDVARMLDQSGQSLQFSKKLLAATLEHIDPGVSVVDADQRIVAWNSRYLELFGYPEGMVHVGAPISDMIRFNAERGDCGPGEVDSHIARRLGHLRRGDIHSFERTRPDGRVLKTVGGPMPGGGYVMCFTDITAEAQARAALEQSRQDLERRVQERTAELTRLNDELARATRDKTRFLAAASHDLLQPLHAARLFTAALGRETGGHRHVERIDQAIGSAEELLRALLDISKLDAGGITPRPAPLALAPLLHEIAESLSPLAAEKRLTLRLRTRDAGLETDAGLLRSIIQNLVTNAIRYTDTGGVLIGVRRRGGYWRIDVIDTGRGIPADQHQAIFQEFHQLQRGGSGIGLGLAIVDRISRLIGARLTLASTPGRGSRFSIALPAATARAAPLPPVPVAQAKPVRRILIVDDNPDVCEAMRAHLEAQGHHVVLGDPDTALAHAPSIDLALVDYHLGEGKDGLTLLARLRAARPALPAALVTADGSEDVAARAAAAGIALLRKPVSPRVLDRWIARAGV